MRTEKQIEFFKSEKGNIKNCQVVEFASDENEKYIEVKSSNPTLNFLRNWRPIQKHLLSPNELLDEVEKYNSLIK